MKSIEQTAREVYKGCYRIAEVRNSSVYTDSLTLALHVYFTNQISLVVGERTTEEAKRLIGSLKSLDTEFYSKFERLIKKQKRNKS